MANYTYTATTYQLGIFHFNKVVAVKFDPTKIPSFVILHQTSADSEGNFTLSWDDWSGRVIIGAFDEYGQFQQLDCVFKDWEPSVLTGTTPVNGSSGGLSQGALSEGTLS